MAQLVVGGMTIPVAESGASWARLEATDRARSFDGTYRSSATGGVARDFYFRTPPVLRASADIYVAQLGIIAAQMCSGDIIGTPTMCCAEITNPEELQRLNVGHAATIAFTLHEVQPAKMLLRYSPGDTITGETFTRSTAAKYRDINGLVANKAIDVKRDGHYDLNDLVAVSTSLLLEDTRSNAAVSPRDLTNAAWTKTNCTTAFTSLGADGIAASATRLTATAGNATCTQAVVLGSSARFMSAYVKRITGTGNIQMTTDGGGTWTTVTTTAAYTRVFIPTQTLANPNFGFRIVTNGDAIDVDFVMNETGTFMTSPTAAAGARGADLYSLPFTTPPQEMTVYVKFIERGTISTANAAQLLFANSASAVPLFAIYAPAGFYTAIHSETGLNVTSALAAAPVYNDTVELCARLFGDGSVDITQSINGAASTAGTQSAANPLSAAWSGALVWPNSASGGTRGFTAIKSIKIVAGVRSLIEMRAA